MKLADALKAVADELDNEWTAGERSAAIDLDDLTEALRRVAEKVEG